MKTQRALTWREILDDLGREHSLGWIAQEAGVSRRTLTRWAQRQATPRLSSYEALWALHSKVCGK